MYLPLPLFNNLHRNLTHLVSSDETKYTITDQNHLPYAIKYNHEIPHVAAIADENGNLKLFKTHPKFQLLKEENIHKNCIYDLVWLNRNDIACGGGDKIVNIIDTNTFEIKSVLKGHKESVKTIACVKTNTSIVASGSRDGSILIYDLRYNKKSSDEAYHSVNTIQVAHLNSATLAVSTPKAKNSHTNANNISPIACVLFQNENLIISAGATDNIIKVWDLRKTYTSKLSNPQPLYSFKNDVSTKGYSNLVLTRCGTRLFANCMNNTIYEYDLCSNKCQSVNFNQHKNSSNFVKSCLSTDEHFLLTGSSDSNACIYPLMYGNYANVIKLENAHQNEITCVAWSPHDINQLITCSDDNSIRVWNVKYDVSSIEKQDNLFKATQIETNQTKFITEDDNVKLFNQKYYTHGNSNTNVYNDFLFTNFQKKFNFKLRKILREEEEKSATATSVDSNKLLHLAIASPTSNLPKKLQLFSSPIVSRATTSGASCLTPTATACLTPKQISLIQTRIPFKSNENTPIQQHQKQKQNISFSTSKKRPLDKIFSEALNLNAQTPPPSSKRRLVLDNSTQSGPNSKSILDYFSPKV